MSRAFARQGVRPEQEVELAEDLWAITIDPQEALEEWLAQAARRRRAARLLGHSHAFQYFVAAAPGREGADHDRQGVGARAARALEPRATAPTTSWSSTRRPPATASRC